ncbi:ankyrin repeat domain-containing protein 9 [Thalassophryne amazonica]|uniref:ankyrin repeat domain-containing protein 9 n=1 Tax=Thalassophryne amazonica TaxID=390379 RepID=UPI0014715525|nr:ankyrin repeat domain-containing protein 9 [Thalassophryne amazonica]
MPWLVSSQLERISSSPSERQCERTSFSFYCAVRDLLPVWLLEDMRCMEVFCWEDGHARAFAPSEALLYALVHDHQDYARYLLNRYAVSALTASRCSFCRRGPVGAPHLKVAVRYNRVSILAMIVEALKNGSAESVRRDYLNSCGGCAHVADAGKTAVQLACELARPECLLVLLVHGASADGVDALLQQLQQERCSAPERRCLDFMLLFVPKLPEPRCLRDDPQRWQKLLGNDVFSWLSGLAPPTLLLQALRALARGIPGQIAALPESLQTLSWQH